MLTRMKRNATITMGMMTAMLILAPCVRPVPCGEATLAPVGGTNVVTGGGCASLEGPRGSVEAPEKVERLLERLVTTVVFFGSAFANSETSELCHQIGTPSPH